MKDDLKINVGDVVKTRNADYIIDDTLGEVKSIEDEKQHDGSTLTLYFVRFDDTEDWTALSRDEIGAVYKHVTEDVTNAAPNEPKFAIGAKVRTTHITENLVTGAACTVRDVAKGANGWTYYVTADYDDVDEYVNESSIEPMTKTEDAAPAARYKVGQRVWTDDKIHGVVRQVCMSENGNVYSVSPEGKPETRITYEEHMLDFEIPF
jgi:hypothetical protein